MRISDISTSRLTKHQAQLNWSRELTFSPRQYNYIRQSVPNERGVYCVYSKDRIFPYDPPGTTNRKWSSVIYVGSGWLDERLACHLRPGRNDVLNNYVLRYGLAYRYSRIYDRDDFVDYPRAVEAALLFLFNEKYGALPPANRRFEGHQKLGCDMFLISQSSNFNIVG